MLAFHRWRQTWAEVVDRYVVPTEFVRGKLTEAGLPRTKSALSPTLFIQILACAQE